MNTHPANRFNGFHKYTNHHHNHTKRMGHSKSKIWIHAVFSTKDRHPLILPHFNQPVYDELRRNLIDMGCFADSIGGVADHVHLLFLLNPTKSIADALKQIKGASSHALNQQALIATRFAWQTGYGAFSVSEGHLLRVRQYIHNQEEHHKTVSFLKEYQQFMEHYGLLMDD